MYNRYSLVVLLPTSLDRPHGRGTLQSGYCGGGRVSGRARRGGRPVDQEPDIRHLWKKYEILATFWCTRRNRSIGCFLPALAEDLQSSAGTEVPFGSLSKKNS